MTFHEVRLVLQNYRQVKRNRTQELYVPRGVSSWVTNMSDIEGFLRRSGLPYVSVEGDCIEAFSGIFNPEPLFYCLNDGNLIIADDIFAVLTRIHRCKPNMPAIKELMEFKNALGNKTAAYGVNLLQAGECLTYNDGKLNVKNSFLYFSKEPISDAELAEELFWDKLKEVFKDYLKALSGKTVVVPLSSGYDSRLIACMLHLMGKKEVVTLTYGVSGERNYELPIAKAVSEKLGFPHVFVEYICEDFKAIMSQIMHTLLWKSQLFRTPNIQELISTKKFAELISESLDACDAVFMPGDTGDFLSGGQISLDMIYCRTLDDLIEAILGSHHTILSDPYPNHAVLALRKYFIESIHVIKSMFGEAPSFVELAEIFNWRERQNKFISTVRLPYLDFGFGYAFPFWDKRLVEFFSSLSLKLKWNQSFYLRFLKRHIFKPLDVNLRHPLKDRGHMAEKLRKGLSTLFIVKGRYVIPHLYHVRKKVGVRTKTVFPLNPCGFDVFFPYIYNCLSNTPLRVALGKRKIKDVHAPVTLLTAQAIIECLSNNCINKLVG